MHQRFYSSLQWRKLRSKVKGKWRAKGLPCGECGLPIDWNAKPIVDHIIPRKTAPERSLDPTNLQVVCHGCNTRRAHGVAPAIQTRDDGFPEGWGDR